MTKTSTKWMCSAALALTLSGCDAGDDRAGQGEDPISFRNGDGTWGVGKLNTNFLGEDEQYPLNALPLSGLPLATESGASVRLHAVWATHCVDRVSGTTYKNGLFYTSGIDGDLGITVDDGALEPATFKMFSKPTVTCTVAANDWHGTVWGVILTDAQGTETHHYLMPIHSRLDEHGNRIYRWGIFTGLNPNEIFNPTKYTPTCIEDSDPFGDAHILKHYAYLIADLAVDPASGDFSVAPDTMYLACRSGAVGKSIHWDYSPWEWGSDTHELATRVVRADYCGAGQSFTKKGNALQVSDQLGVNEFTKPELEDEAAWDLATSRATCVTMPRDAGLQEDFEGIVCGDAVLPECTPEAMTDSIITTKLAS
jgi:hypothetical protein